MKNKRDHTRWTIREIEADSAGYLAAQEARREDRRREQAERAEQQDRAAFEREFLAAGGTKSGAGDAWRQRRDEAARTAAGQAEESARHAARSGAMGAV